MNKKIGIITFHIAENYGAVLQAYALLSALKRELPEIDFSIVDYKPKSITSTYEIFYSFKSVKSPFKKIAYLVISLLHLPETLRKKYHFKYFRDNYLRVNSDWKHTNYDCIICGSDQIWNPSLTEGIDNVYFADFCCKKIAYAVSDGGESLLNDNMLSLITDFSALSVREKTLENRLKTVLNKDVYTVLDPVFLVSHTNWAKNLLNIYIKDTNYILVYCLHASKAFDELMKQLSHRLDKKIVVVSYARSIRTIFHNKITYRTAVSPFEFLKYIYEADFIFTNSFHCTAFSIIFRKSFFVPFLSKRADRIVDMLALFDLSERYITRLPESIEDFTINYSEKITHTVNAEIQKSIQFLLKSIKEIECI